MATPQAFGYGPGRTVITAQDPEVQNLMRTRGISEAVALGQVIASRNQAGGAAPIGPLPSQPASPTPPSPPSGFPSPQPPPVQGALASTADQQVGGAGAFAPPGSQTSFLQAFNQLFERGKSMDELRQQRFKLVMQLYDRDLTPEELRDLSPSQQRSIREGNRSLMEFEIKKIGDVISGRDDVNMKSMDYLLKGYEADLEQVRYLQERAEIQKKESQQQLLTWADKYDLSTLAPDVVQRLKSGTFTAEDAIKLSGVSRTVKEKEKLRFVPGTRYQPSGYFDPQTGQFVQTGLGGTQRTGGGTRRLSGGRRNELTMSEAKRFGLPLELVGMTEAEVGTILADPNPPDWFVTKVQEEKQQSLVLSYVKQLWDEFRRTAQQPSTRTTTSSRASSLTSSRLTIPQEAIEAAMRTP